MRNSAVWRPHFVWNVPIKKYNLAVLLVGNNPQNTLQFWNKCTKGLFQSMQAISDLFIALMRTRKCLCTLCMKSVLFHVYRCLFLHLGIYSRLDWCVISQKLFLNDRFLTNLFIVDIMYRNEMQGLASCQAAFTFLALQLIIHEKSIVVLKLWKFNNQKCVTYMYMFTIIVRCPL
jgi:hypothetical protein